MSAVSPQITVKERWVAAEAVFPFAVVYLKRRARTPRREEFLGRDLVTIPEASVKETSLAFKLIYRPTRGLKFSKIVRKWNAHIWWPWPAGLGDEVSNENVTAQKFHRMLRDGSEDPLDLGISGQDFSEKLEARKVISTDIDVRLAIARRQAQGFLLCGKHVFRKGGEPVYLIEKSYSRRANRFSAFVTVIDPSLLRPPVAIDEDGQLFVSVPYWRGSLFKAAASGLVFRANQRLDAIETARKIDPSYQSWKCPEIIAFGPIEADLIELRVNAAFCLALCLEGKEPPSELVPAIDPAATFTDRAFCLRQYLKAGRQLHRSELVVLLNKVASLVDFSLSQADDEFLTTL